MTLTPEVLQRCWPQATPEFCATWAPAVDAAAKEFGIDTSAKLAAWLASMSNESGQGHRLEEMTYAHTDPSRIVFVFGSVRTPPLHLLSEWQAPGDDYFDKMFFNWLYDDRRPGNPSLGNNEDGDGFKHRGLGPLQITGKNNNHAVGAATGINFVSDPTQHLDPVKGARGAAAFFAINHIGEKAADGTEAGFLSAMRAMNPGLAESEFQTHHLARWHEVRAGLGLDASGNPTAPEDVRPVQVAVNAWLRSMILVEDNAFGPKTKQAIRLYQFVNGLRVTGVADDETRKKLGVSR